MRTTGYWLLTVIALGAGGCSSSGPPRDLTPPDLFAWAQEQFDAEEYGKAKSRLLEGE